MQQILNDEGLHNLKVVDKDHVATIVDGFKMIFSRDDQYSGQQGSGLAYFGSVSGDHRMIRAIADDIEMAFSLI